jgi:hypothetical protein
MLDVYPVPRLNGTVYQEYMGKLGTIVSEPNEQLTLQDKSWACYWLMKVKTMERPELIIVKQWFDSLPIDTKEQLPPTSPGGLAGIKLNP